MNKINTGSLQNPFEIMTYTIPAGGIQLIAYAFKSINFYDVSSQNALIRFIGNARTSPIFGGLGIELQQAQQGFEILNDGESTLTITFAVSMGTLKDNRLSVSGVLDTRNVGGEPYALLYVDTLTIPANGTLSLNPNGAVKTRIQAPETNAEKLRLYASDGFEVYPTGIEELTLDSTFSVYGKAGDKVIFGRFGK